MSWNEQGGDKDPWGGRRGDQAPPDIDEALKRLKEKSLLLSRGKRVLGKGSGSGSGGGISGVKNLLPIFFTGLLVLYGLAVCIKLMRKSRPLFCAWAFTTTQSDLDFIGTLTNRFSHGIGCHRRASILYERPHAYTRRKYCGSCAISAI